MGELFWNKVAGSVLTAALLVFVLNEASHLVYHESELEEPAYPWEVAESAGAGAGDADDAVAVSGPPDFGALLMAADASNGERVARQCVACHSLERGGATMQGPNLWDIVGRAAGAVDGFPYSSAMQAYGQAWNHENLYAYLQNPRDYMPGTNMSFSGIRDQGQRINLVAFLYSLSDSPQPFPEPRAVEIEADAPSEAEDAAPEGGAEPESVDGR